MVADKKLKENIGVTSPLSGENADRKVNPVFDIAKFVMAIGVVFIHANFLPDILYPWLRMAVPMFFMISSYLLFTKLNGIKSKGGNPASAVWRFTKRNLILYGFWFVVLSPLTFYLRNYFAVGLIRGFLKLLKSFLFASTFVASWYIIATVIGTLVVVFLSRYINNKLLFAITLMLHICISIWSAHYPLVAGVDFINAFTTGYKSLFLTPWGSFPVSLFWIVCGKCFADGTIDLKKGFSIAMLVLSAIGIYAEWLLSKTVTGIRNCDSLIFLAPLCIATFSIIKKINVKSEKNTVSLRKSSTIIYALHGSVVQIMSKLSQIVFGESYGIVRFFATLLFCLAVCYVILKLEKLKPFSWLKYSH